MSRRLGFVRRVLRGSAFRAALWNAVFFGSLAAVALGFLWVETAGVRRQAAERAVDAEFAALNKAFGRSGLFGGMAGLAREVAARGARAPDSVYLLMTRPGNRPLAGNVPLAPALAALEEARASKAWDGWLEFSWPVPFSDRSRHYPRRVALARVLNAGRDGILIVGRRVDDLVGLESILTRVIIGGGFLAIVLGLGMGALTGWGAQRRVEGLRRDLLAIREEGDLDRRLLARGDDELARLAREVNATLDRLAALMVGMRQVSGDVAHEMRSPLGRLRNRLEQVLAGHGEGDDYREAVERAVNDVDSVLRTFDSLLRIARAESGASAVPEAMAMVDVADIVRDVGELYAPVLAERGGTLEALAPTAIVLRGHRDLLFQALVNLVENALSHGVPAVGAAALELGASIETDATASRWAVLEVRDNGPGIPEALRAKAMERFVRLNTDSGRVKGSGLGLALVRAAARLHHGVLTLGGGLGGGLDGTRGLVARVRLPIPKASLGEKRSEKSRKNST